MGLHMNTLNIEVDAKFLGAQRETIWRMAASGVLLISPYIKL